MIDVFIFKAILAGIGVAVVSALIGCFVVWRRMAYFGDSLSHSGLLGVAFGLLAGLNIAFSILIICVIFAVLLLWLQEKQMLTTDTLLGILSHLSLSLGLVVIAFLNYRVNLHAYLFGDILTVTTQEIGWIYAAGFFIVVLILYNWSSLVLMTIDENLAKCNNISTGFHRILLVMIMTVVVAISVRIVGVLLITALLIIPSSAARQFSKSPEAMAFFALFIGGFSVLIGIVLSVFLNTPSSPTIVLVSGVIFLLSFLFKKF